MGVVAYQYGIAVAVAVTRGGYRWLLAGAAGGGGSRWRLPVAVTGAVAGSGYRCWRRSPVAFAVGGYRQ